MGNNESWYEPIEQDTLLQGDIVFDYPILSKSQEKSSRDLDQNNNMATGKTLEGKLESYDFIVLSQSCDLIADKIVRVLLCPIWTIDEFKPNTPEKERASYLEEIRKGHVIGYHMLDRIRISDLEKNYLIVDFRNVHSVDLKSFKQTLENKKRIRLLSPYREHLSQAFARFFMRVGLPADIPSFKK